MTPTHLMGMDVQVPARSSLMAIVGFLTRVNAISAETDSKNLQRHVMIRFKEMNKVVLLTVYLSSPLGHAQEVIGLPKTPVLQITGMELLLDLKNAMTTTQIMEMAVPLQE